jgi:hypothetical protein
VLKGALKLWAGEFARLAEQFNIVCLALPIKPVFRKVLWLPDGSALIENEHSEHVNQPGIRRLLDV